MKNLVLACLLASLSACEHILPPAKDPRANPLPLDGVVRVEFAPRTHWALGDNQIMRAALTDDGKRWIVVNADMRISNMDAILLHEMAHHVAWERYGIGIQEHGPEYRKVCAELLPSPIDQARFCRERAWE